MAALAVAYDGRFRDPRVRAAIILSGAEPAGMRASQRGPPLLAMQGTADPINDPSNTIAYYRFAHRPKFLVLLVGASHRLPYTASSPSSGSWSALRSPSSITTSGRRPLPI